MAENWKVENHFATIQEAREGQFEFHIRIQDMEPYVMDLTLNAESGELSGEIVSLLRFVEFFVLHWPGAEGSEQEKREVADTIAAIQKYRERAREFARERRKTGLPALRKKLEDIMARAS